MQRWIVRLGLLGALAALLPACGSSGGGGSVVSGFPPGLPVSALLGLSQGGVGSTGDGGSGGSFSVYANTGGDVRILSSGTVNSQVNVPVVMPDLGPNPRIVDADETWVLDDGNIFSGNAWIQNAGLDATGLWIKPGATLTIPGNFGDQLLLNITHSLYIEGTLRVGFASAGTSDDSCDFHVWLGQNLVVTPSGTIDVSGKSNVNGVVSTDGGNGGRFNLNGFAQGPMTIVNAGLIDTRGGEGTNGGDGGRIRFESFSHGAYNSGTIDSSGGEGYAGDGGNAGRIVMAAQEVFAPGGVHNTGSILARGGQGDGGDGGNGAGIDLEADAGSATSSGTLDTSGGNAASGDFAGGNAARIDVYAGRGSVRISGTLRAAGGDGSGTEDGGDGNDIDVWVDPSTVATGSAFGANFDTGGGDGANGGSAGSVDIVVNGSSHFTPGESIVWIVGFASIDLSGGDGAVAGGSAGGLYVENENLDVEQFNYSGSIRNDVPVLAVGGQGGTGTGGDGGYAFLHTTGLEPGPNEGSYPGDLPQSVVNTGDLDLRGGSGDDGGDAGYAYLYDAILVDNSGDIDASGGADTGAGGTGGSAWDDNLASFEPQDPFNNAPPGAIVLRSRSAVRNSGALAANGGASSNGDGGQGGFVSLQSPSTNTSGAISAVGGNGNAGTGTGGDGGTIEITSSEHTSAVAALDVSGGTGDTAGADGTAIVDGVVQP